ncbi:MAG TPA: hypothetical protein VN704_04220 [Verrucomicrobiae bacterium]|nr:hypothetical protein [Verrucomicrobiae bacterium]
MTRFISIPTSWSNWFPDLPFRNLHITSDFTDRLEIIIVDIHICQNVYK